MDVTARPDLRPDGGHQGLHPFVELPHQRDLANLGQVDPDLREFFSNR
jgi:hypothetical protein